MALATETRCLEPCFPIQPSTGLRVLLYIVTSFFLLGESGGRGNSAFTVAAALMACADRFCPKTSPRTGSALHQRAPKSNT